MQKEEHIKIIHNLSSYKAINDRDQWFPRVTAEKVKIQEEIKYPDGGSWPVIQINCLNDDTLLELDTVQSRKGTKKEVLRDYKLPNHILQEFYEKFKLYSRTEILHSLEIPNKDYYSSYGNISIKSCEKCNATYMAIYGKRSESGRDDDNVLYVHGIWQVALSKEFKEHLVL